MNKKIILDKLFPKIKGLDLQKLLIDKDTVSYITTPYYSKIIGNTISDHMKQFGIDNDNIYIVDSTACVGGDTITFGTMFNKVISIELNEKWYNYLKNNIYQYNLKNITTINGNAIDIIPKLNDINVIYIDPPWGGKNYKNTPNLRLFFANNELENVVINFFNIPHSKVRLIALKLPQNYDLKYFYDTLILQKKFDIYLYQLKKINLVIVQLKEFTNSIKYIELIDPPKIFITLEKIEHIDITNSSSLL
jgi:tRNA G37 N-methylase Trm5